MGRLSAPNRTGRRPVATGNADRLQELPRQIDCSAEKAVILAPRNLDTSKLLQVWRKPLRIEQDKFASAQMFHQRYERNFGRVSHPMKHRFAKKRPADCDTV